MRALWTFNVNAQRMIVRAVCRVPIEQSYGDLSGWWPYARPPTWKDVFFEHVLVIDS
jgi:hypothetical protein